MMLRLPLLVLLTVLGPASAGAQTFAEPARPLAADDGADRADAAAGAANPAPAAEPWIRAEDIADRADALTQRLDSRRPTAGDEATLQKVESGITRIESDLKAALAQAKAALAGSSSLIVVQDARRELEGVSQPLATWKEQLAVEAKRAAEAIDEATDAHRRWLATRGRPETAEAGEAVVKRVESSVALLQDFIRDMQGWRVRVLAAGDRLLDHSTAVTEAIRKLEGATVDQSSSLVVPSHPPIWRRNLPSQLAVEIRQVPQRLRAFHESTTEYFLADERPFLLQAFLAVSLMFLLRGLPQHAQRRLEQARVAPQTARLLERPYAIVLLLVLMLSPALHPTAPQRVVQLLGLIALFPVARILMLAHGRADLWLYAGLFVLLVIDRLSIALSALSSIVLVAFVVQLGLALTLAVGYRRRLLAGGRSLWVVRVLDAGMVGLGLSLIAQLGGWSSLAAIVGRGILTGGVTALYIYAAIISLEAIIAYVLAIPAMRRSRFVDRNQQLLHRWTMIVVRFAGTVFGVRVVLSSLGLRDVAADVGQAVLAASITVGQLSISVGGVAAFVLTLVFAKVFSSVVHEVLEDEVFPRTNLPRGIPHALLSLTNYAIYSLGFVFALAAAGVQMGQLSILLGGLGVGIGLGLQDLVKNFAAGITLLLERRVHVGDAVQIPDKDVFGRVLSIGMRASVVRNWNGAEVILPNDDLVSGTVTNLTLSDQLQRIEVPLGVAYGTDPATVIELLLGVAAADKRLLENPAPSAFFQGFGDSSLDFILRAWTDEQYEFVASRRSELAVAVHGALRDAGIEIPFPQRDVNLIRVSPQVGEMLRPA